MPIHVFRVLKGAQAVRDDFLSDEARRKRPRDTSSEALTRHRGFSVWRTEAHARAVARRFPKLGTHIAEVELPIGATLLPFPDTSACPSTRLRYEVTEMTYELWDHESGNAQGIYPSLLAALQVVHDAVELDGVATLDGLALIEVRPGGDRRMIAEERDLIPLVGIGALATG